MTKWVELCTLGDLVVRGAERYGRRDAFVFPGERMSYVDLERRATDVARSLVALGVERKDHVGILMPNCPDMVAAMFGAVLAGAVAVPINARFKAHELGYVVAKADLRVLLTTDLVDEHTPFASLLHEALPGLAEAHDPAALALDAAPELRAAVMLGASTPDGFVNRRDFDAAAAAVSEAVVDHRRQSVRVADPAFMFFTSGTTAMPKGCPLSHEAMMRCSLATVARAGYREGDVLWDPLPMFHTAATQPMMAILHVGGTYVSQLHFDPELALEQIEQERATLMFPAFPTITQAILGHPGYRPERLATVRSVFNVAPPDLLRAMQAALPPGATQITAFGMTEFAGSVVMVHPHDSLELRSDSQGPPFPGIEIEIRDADNKPVPVGERGEVVVRGPSSFTGYYKDEAKTAECLEPGGWFHTGDLGCVDAEGRLSYLGRLKDMLKVGGENVAAIEIESYLATHPAVSLAQVVGVADDKYGEVPAAFIEVKPGAVLTESEVIDHCKGRIASFKVPRHVRFVTEWPMSSTKVQKFRLREQLEAELRDARH